MKYFVHGLILVAFAAIATTAFIGAASAGWTCQRVGHMTYCYNSQTGQQYTCQQIGNATYCN